MDKREHATIDMKKKSTTRLKQSFEEIFRQTKMINISSVYFPLTRFPSEAQVVRRTRWNHEHENGD